MVDPTVNFPSLLEHPSSAIGHPYLPRKSLSHLFVCVSQVMHAYTALENFWRRYNKVLLDKLAQDREKFLLEDENTQLKALLKQYLDGRYWRCFI